MSTGEQPPRLADSAAFYADGLDIEDWFRVADVDYEELARAYDRSAVFASSAPHLLDVGCGTGKFRSQYPA